MFKGAVRVITLIFAALFPATISYAQSAFDSCSSGRGNIFNATLVIPSESVADINGTALDPGSEIAVFRVGQNEPESCAGRTSWMGESNYLTIWANDPSTPAVDGLQDGDAFEIRVYDALTDQIFSSPLLEDQLISGDNSFSVDGVYILSSLTTVALEETTEAAALPERQVLTMPPNQSVDVTMNQRFEWSAGGGSSSYRIQVTNATDYAFEKVLVDRTTLNNYLSIDELTPESSFMWRVKAFNTAGESQWSRIFRFSTGFYSTSTANETMNSDGEIPEVVFLDQNYPNPFNPSTTIPFGLPHTMHVRLEIFDILGRSQTVLIDDTLVAGNHRAIWNAQLSSSGFYIYRLTTETSVLTGTLSLLK